MSKTEWGLFLAAVFLVCAGCQVRPAADVDPYRTLPADPSRDVEAAKAHTRQGSALLRGGDLKGAEAEFRAALSADLFFGPAHNNLGIVYLRQQKCYLAAWEFRYAAKLMPHRPEPRNNLGLVMERVGKLAEAAASYQEALAAEPDNPEFIGNLARCRIRLGRRTPETADLLHQLILKDTRQEWTEWAKAELTRMPKESLRAPAVQEDTPTSQPAPKFKAVTPQPALGASNARSEPGG